MAKDQKTACYKTFAYKLLPLEEIGEDTAVFFAVDEITEPPFYVGSVNDSDFLEIAEEYGLKCGMYLPQPGTNVPETEN